MSRERTQAEIREMCDKACAILKKTNDGDLLEPSDLKLIENAANGFLNEEGREVFEKLYQRVVVDGTYIKPYLHDIEHITRDHEGYIYYKELHVEHYDRDWVGSEDAKNSLLELKRRCEFLERKGIEVSSGSAVWGWDNYADEYGSERLSELDSILDEKKLALPYSRVELYNSGREFVYFVCGNPPSLDEIKNHPVTKSMVGRFYDDEYEITVKPFIYAKNGAYTLKPLNEITDRAYIENLLMSCHNYMRAYDKLLVIPEITHKTDFAAGYDNTKRLDSLLNSPGRSLEYSHVDLWAANNKIVSFFLYGTPTLDEIKEHFEYKLMSEVYGVNSVRMTTFVYGKGEPLRTAELPPIDETELLLSEVHDYLKKNGLSKETTWTNLTDNIVVNRNNNYQAEPEEEAEDGYEP